MSYRNRELVKDLDKSTAIKAYIAAQKELDKALEELLNKLNVSRKHAERGMVRNVEEVIMDMRKNTN